MSSQLNLFKKDMGKLSNKKKAAVLSGFFKTGKGQYGEGDIFFGIVVPEQRKVAKKYNDLGMKDVQALLSSKIHEYRLTALFILVCKYEKAHNVEKKKIFDFYLKNTKNINNWDLVDLSAGKIIGDYCLENIKSRKILYKLAKSKNLWEKRIGILATFAFIKENEFKDTLKISKILLDDRLIKKFDGKKRDEFLDKRMFEFVPEKI